MYGDIVVILVWFPKVRLLQSVRIPLVQVPGLPSVTAIFIKLYEYFN